ncbi:MAG: alpha-L-fucosidase [Oceanipulchritudo sp.]
MDNSDQHSNKVPAFLRDTAHAYQSDPREAALAWFREARFGLFMHYGLYSLLEGEWPDPYAPRKGAEWIQWAGPVPRQQYMALKERFTAERFDADAICRLALEAGMKYVNLTSQHHDGFSLWDTQTNDYSSMHAPARRDLVAELAEACERYGLGCFLYYSHGREWFHPDGPDTGPEKDGFNSSKPIIDTGHFHHGNAVVLDRYLELVEAQVMELCAYPNIAGIWLDGIGGFKKHPDGMRLSRAQELYDRIHASSPHILVAYKQGLTYTEDFYAPERDIKEGTLPSDGRPYEICTTLQPTSWGYKKADDGKHHGPDWVIDQLRIAGTIPANLLLNTGPLGDGSIPEEDIATLKEVGSRLARANS